MASPTKFALYVACALLFAPAIVAPLAQEAEFVPETLGVKAAIDPGSNVFVNKQEWGGASSIGVYSADDLAFKGLMTAGGMGQILISPDGKTAYGQSTYMKRIMYGDVEQVLQVYNVATLTPVKEIILPPKAAMVAAYTPLLEQSADGKFVYVQNATPATSVTVVDIAAGTVTQEVPTPGCWGIYPSLEGYKFSSICGDGTFASFTISQDGTTSEKVTSEKIFDVDEDPIFVPAERIGADLVFASYHGNIYKLADAEGAITLTEKVSVTEGIEGGWAPGGYGLITYNEANGILFIGMHPEAYDGSHKNAAEEIWAYDVANARLLYRTSVHGISSITVSDAAAPVLYALNEEDSTLLRFESDPEAKFVLKETNKAEDTGFATVVQVRP
jgi:methylamine dehydrogenase heavy chain